MGDGTRREPDVTMGKLLLTEYQTVKDEQKARIGFRDNLLYVTLAAVAAVSAAAAQTGRLPMLLALPPVCTILGWTYLVNDEKISAIGAYVRGDLGPRLAALAAPTAEGGQPPAEVFGWETAHRRDVRRRSRKAIQCAVDLLAFCVVPLAGLCVYWVAGEGEGGGLLLAVSVVEALVTGVLGWQVVSYARPLGRRGGS
ncbi:hypothetical protein [Streptomyces sp. NPDC059009]|uniref:hypothetical protein n=1 Tax=Streptomyces sp. NPDC059009 TaxID=3346694 RepID=UPI0036BDACF0